MQAKRTKKKNKMDPNAVVQSLKSAIIMTHDYSAACAQIRNRLRRLPKDPLHPDRQHNGIYFYTNGKYLRKESDLLYSLARKRYCAALLNVLTQISELPASMAQRDPFQSEQCSAAFAKLDKLIHDYADGNLDLARILLTQQQYTWYVGDYHKKPFSGSPNDQILLNPQGDRVLSKSEQNIGIALWDLAVPCHFEELLRINVQRLVDALQKDLKEQGLPSRQLYYYQSGICFWNVPEHLQWMNAPGSIWRAYDSRSGCIRIHPDYTIMLADGTLLYWEHEGLLESFVYRANSTERVSIMLLSGRIARENLIETFEKEANDRQTLEQIIEARILPRLWF